MEKKKQISPVKTRILDLSFYAFNQKGYKAVSMDLVARELRISKKTIYKHFSAKEEILETALEGLFAQVEGRLKGLSKMKTPKETFLAFQGIYFDFLRTLSPLLRSEVKRDLPYIHERIESFERQVLYRSFSKLLKDLRNKNIIEYPSPTREFTATFFALLAGLIHSPEDKVTFALSALFRGISVKKGKNDGKKKRK